MAILSIQIGQVGTTSVTPQICYINTNDTIAAVTTAGYLNNAMAEGFKFPNGSLCAITTKTSPSSTAVSSGWYSIQLTGSGGVNLVPTTQPGDVTLPTIANHIATFTNTTGGISENAATAINGGNIQAGLSGTAGTLASYPATGAKGSLVVAAVANTGNTITTISNDAMGQASVVNIPDPANAIGQFLVGATATPLVSGNFPQNSGTAGLVVDSGLAVSAIAQTANVVLLAPAADQTITAHNLIVSQGNLQAGSSGHAGTVGSFPGTAAEGELILAAVNNATGNFNTTVSNAAAVAQSQVITIPDSGATTANFILSKSGAIQHITSSGLSVDAGSLLAGLAAGGTAGGLTLYPATASNGSFVLTPVGNAGNFAATVSPVSTLGQASVYTIPDPGAATSNIAVTGGALVSGNFPKASGTAGVLVDSGFSPVFGATAGIPYTAIVTMNAATVIASYGTPTQIIATPGAAFTIMVLNAQVITEVSTPFTSGGVAIIQYGSTVHGAGTNACSATIASAEITAASSQIFTMAPIASATVMATASFKNLGLYFSNATQQFATGTGSTVTIAITYMIIPTT